MSAVMVALLHLLLLIASSDNTRAFSTHTKHPSTNHSRKLAHPAVEGWAEKYSGDGIIVNSKDESPAGTIGPRVIGDVFQVEEGTPELLNQLDVTNWPIWTTGDKEKWQVDKLNANKVMPYGELSYVLSGKLEISVGNERFVVSKGDFVTFPEGFQSDWRVLEELSWHYFLY